jgi:mannosyltransferase OCH1-like enzyme
MNFTEQLRYRSIKVLANACKVTASIGLRFFPSARWEIPKSVMPRQEAGGPKAIPRIIWQTNYTNRVSLAIYLNFLFNRFISPTFEYRYCDDDTCDQFVREYFPGAVWDAYSKLQVGAAKADFWRVLVLLAHGGIYLDIDSNFAAPPEGFIKDDASELLIIMKNGEITNYFMASAPGNPLLQRMVDKIVANIADNTLASVYDMTGPTVVDAIAKEAGVTPANYQLVCTQGQFTNKKSQYVDKPNGTWWTEQSQKSIVRD